ncbi:hypothetical protein [Achromobacter marplatensis]|uniref:hypothetical protein n=1 Tax=Achromobacter marplatensis TaxID=470868 RepID=UPI003C74C8C2
MTNSNCSCPVEDDIIVTITGRVVDDDLVLSCENRGALVRFEKLRQSPCGIFCENQTLADNVTLSYTFDVEVTTQSSPLQLDADTSIAFRAVSEEGVLPVNTSMPAIGVSINSFSGERGRLLQPHLRVQPRWESTPASQLMT